MGQLVLCCRCYFMCSLIYSREIIVKYKLEGHCASDVTKTVKEILISLLTQSFVNVTHKAHVVEILLLSR